uniref:SPRY-associated domain-containing protein n=1 Tax=Periophthalmus magnuspinnatus TaxID=409849 RepID=A0A3B3ZAA7_9GOBI
GLSPHNCGPLASVLSSSKRGGAALVSALCSTPSHLRELDLSYNHPGPSTELLTVLRDDPHCHLQSLRCGSVIRGWFRSWSLVWSKLDLCVSGWILLENSGWSQV